MKYDIYFHNDFDGRASAAVFLNFLRGRGDIAGNYYAIDHGDKRAMNWEKVISSGKNPTAIFDFYFHPRATFFFDHHATTFKRKDWERGFRPSKFHVLNPRYKSCCRLVMDALQKNFKYKPPEHIRELAKWADMVDAADYASPRQTIELKEPALELDAFVDEKSPTGSLDWLIELLSEKPVKEIVSMRKVQSVVKVVRAKIKKSTDFARKNLQIYGKVTFLDLSRVRLQRVRFAPQYFYPKLRYTVTLMKDIEGFKVAVGGNPWRKNTCKVDLGLYARKKYGGGGHKRAAGITAVKSRAEGLKIAMELVEYLQKK